MKTLLSLLILTSGILFANANTDWVDGQIKAIKPPRSGISHTAINAIKNPFIYVYPESKASDSNAAAKTATTTAPKPLRLSAVMNNVALINGTWYRVNQRVYPGQNRSRFSTVNIRENEKNAFRYRRESQHPNQNQIGKCHEVISS